MKGLGYAFMYDERDVIIDLRPQSEGGDVPDRYQPSRRLALCLLHGLVFQVGQRCVPCAEAGVDEPPTIAMVVCG